MIGTSGEDGKSDGTQAIRRAAAILRLIGQGHAQGASLAEVGAAMQLSRSTAHRIMKCLVDEGLVKHDPARKRYVIGRLVYELGLTVTSETLEIARWSGAVARVAARTGATAYLMGRSGVEAVCLLKQEGNAVIRVIPVDIGQRRYLGVGAGATALLAALDAPTRENILSTIAPHLGDFPAMSEAVIRRHIAEAQTEGLVVSRSNVVRDVIGIGMAIPDGDRAPWLSLSIASLESQASPQMVADWKEILREEIAAGI